MKIERTHNASRNIIFGVILKVYQVIIPFIMRTVMLYYLGAEYLGLSSLFVSILQVLNLVELGIGSAMVYSMYKPIVDNNQFEICALMRLYKIYYTVIGLIVAVLGIMLLPFLPNLIKGSFPKEINIHILYLLNLGTTVLSYWLFAYKNSLLLAHQRTDIISKINIFMLTFQYILQLFVLIILKNYYLYIVSMLLTQAFTNIIIAKVVNKIYPKYRAEGKLSKEKVKEINKRIRDLFTSKLGAVVINSADTVVISYFLGLTALAIYQNYFLLIKAVISFVDIIFSSCTAGIGNSIIVETKEKNYNDLKKLTFIIIWITNFCSSCFLCLLQPFVKIWVGSELMLQMNVVICFCIYYFLYEINRLLNTYKDAAGIWHEDRYRPLVTALVNLVLNIILIQIIGIFGVILCTIISMLFVGMPWLLHNLFTVLFEKEQLKEYLKDIFGYILVAIISCTITYYVCKIIVITGIFQIIINLIICIIIPNLIFIVIYHTNKEFIETIKLIDTITKNKLYLKKIFLKERI